MLILLTIVVKFRVLPPPFIGIASKPLIIRFFVVSSKVGPSTEPVISIAIGSVN